MSADGVTFGQAISKARKALGLSQKELAARVMKEEGGGSISQQYLNDIEHDRRSPSSGHLIRQFSGILNIPDATQFSAVGDHSEHRDLCTKCIGACVGNVRLRGTPERDKQKDGQRGTHLHRDTAKERRMARVWPYRCWPFPFRSGASPFHRWKYGYF